MKDLTAHINRKVGLFVLGAGLLIWDVTIYTPGDVAEPLLAFYGMLLGLPFVLKGEEALRNERTRRDDEESK